jgi:hypothetical protein
MEVLYGYLIKFFAKVECSVANGQECHRLGKKEA